MDSNIFTMLGTAHGVVYLAITVIVVLVLATLGLVLHVNYLTLVHKLVNLISRGFGNMVTGCERRYYRDLTIGRINEKRKRVVIYRFLNDLIIDLGIKRRGATPYEFLFLVAIGAAVVSILIGAMLGTSLMAVILYPIVFAGLMCGLYTKANLAHDGRIDAVIEAENIISNNIKGGVIASVRSSLDVIPEEVRNEFRDFLDNIEQKNYHVVIALTELNNNLGTIADDFIKKCIMFETEEEHGYSGVFKDVVEVNNIKTAIRNDVKRKFEVVTSQFVISVMMVFGFLALGMIVYSILADFYLKSIVGNFVLALDALFIIGEFVYITYLRAQEL